MQKTSAKAGALACLAVDCSSWGNGCHKGVAPQYVTDSRRAAAESKKTCKPGSKHGHTSTPGRTRKQAPCLQSTQRRFSPRARVVSKIPTCTLKYEWSAWPSVHAAHSGNEPCTHSRNNLIREFLSNLGGERASFGMWAC